MILVNQNQIRTLKKTLDQIQEEISSLNYVNRSGDLISGNLYVSGTMHPKMIYVSGESYALNLNGSTGDFIDIYSENASFINGSGVNFFRITNYEQDPSIAHLESESGVSINLDNGASISQNTNLVFSTTGLFHLQRDGSEVLTNDSDNVYTNKPFSFGLTETKNISTNINSGNNTLIDSFSQLDYFNREYSISLMTDNSCQARRIFVSKGSGFLNFESASLPYVYEADLTGVTFFLSGSYPYINLYVNSSIGTGVRLFGNIKSTKK